MTPSLRGQGLPTFVAPQRTMAAVGASGLQTWAMATLVHFPALCDKYVVPAHGLCHIYARELSDYIREYRGNKAHMNAFHVTTLHGLVCEVCMQCYATNHTRFFLRFARILYALDVFLTDGRLHEGAWAASDIHRIITSADALTDDDVRRLYTWLWCIRT